MNKFNRAVGDSIRNKRWKNAARKRQMGIVGKPDESAWSGQRTGKHKRLELRRWRRAQKSAIDSGLVTLEDIEMMVAENEASQKDKTTVSEQQPETAGPMKAKGFKMTKKSKVKSLKSKDTSASKDAAQEPIQEVEPMTE